MFKSIIEQLSHIKGELLLVVLALAVLFAAITVKYFRSTRAYLETIHRLPSKDRKAAFLALTFRLPERPTARFVALKKWQMAFFTGLALFATGIIMTAMVLHAYLMDPRPHINDSSFTRFVFEPRELMVQPLPGPESRRRSELPQPAISTPAPQPAPEPLIPIARADLEKACFEQLSARMLESDKHKWCRCGIRVMLESGIGVTLQGELLNDFGWALNDAKKRDPDLGARLGQCAV